MKKLKEKFDLLLERKFKMQMLEIPFEGIESKRWKARENKKKFCWFIDANCAIKIQFHLIKFRFLLQFQQCQSKPYLDEPRRYPVILNQVLKLAMIAYTWCCGFVKVLANLSTGKNALHLLTNNSDEKHFKVFFTIVQSSRFL